MNKLGRPAIPNATTNSQYHKPSGSGDFLNVLTRGGDAWSSSIDLLKLREKYR